MNILITGSKGQLGSEIRAMVADYPEFTFVFTDIDELDITNLQAIKSIVRTQGIQAIINCAAYTAVDKAEQETEIAFKINALAVENLALAAKEFNCTLLHVSTDYVFNGEKNTPYIESDATRPIGKYGESKLAGEKAMLAINPKGAIVRTSWLYSSFGNNFVKTMLRLGKERREMGVVYDQVGTPTYASDLAKALLESLPKITQTGTEIYHYSNEGVCSWYDFAKYIFEQEKYSVRLKPIRSEQFPTPTKRPAFSVLDKAKIKNTFGLTISHWTESLEKCLAILRQTDYNL